jgi:hypothetical protein
MEDQIMQKLEELERKIDENKITVDKMRRYFMWTLIISAVVIILPIFGLLFAIPQFLSSYGDIGNLGL